MLDHCEILLHLFLRFVPVSLDRETLALEL